jgi:hypothetical protein
MKFSGHYVIISGDKGWFDWDGFLNAVLNYRGGDLQIVPIPNPTLVRKNPFPNARVIRDGDIVKVSSIGEHDTLQVSGIPEIALSVIVNWMVATLQNVFTVAINYQELYASVEATFTNLKWASESGFANFSSSTTGTNSSWEYRVVYAIPQNVPNVFHSMVITIVLEADIRTETSWWGLESHTTARFFASITGLRLAVTKGFMDPS